MRKIHHYMVVDDDSTNNMICEFTVKRYDKQANIKSYTKPEEALSFLQDEFSKNQKYKPTILFLDVNMPTMTGWEFLDEFSILDEAVKDQFVIYILSSSIEDFKEEAEMYPMVKGFLSKPLKLEYLEEIMSELYNSSTT